MTSSPISIEKVESAHGRLSLVPLSAYSRQVLGPVGYRTGQVPGETSHPPDTASPGHQPEAGYSGLGYTHYLYAWNGSESRYFKREKGPL